MPVDAGVPYPARGLVSLVGRQQEISPEGTAQFAGHIQGRLGFACRSVHRAAPFVIGQWGQYSSPG
jgi:hypothetical protein